LLQRELQTSCNMKSKFIQVGTFVKLWNW